MQEKGSELMAADVSRDFEYAEKPKRSPGTQLAIDIGETIILTVLMFLVIRLAVQDFQVDGTSMVPTLQNNQFVLVDKLTYTFGQPSRGDVIVFEFPLNHQDDYIKRVIGLPGDRVYVSDNGQVSVNSVVLNEPYVNNLDNPYGEKSYVVGKDQYFVLGDNRGFSSDSRDWGLVNRSEIIGKATLVYWPVSVLHFLPNEQQVYAHVPQSTSSIVTPTNARTVVHPRDYTSLAFAGFIGFGFLAIRRRVARAHQK